MFLFKLINNFNVDFFYFWMVAYPKSRFFIFTVLIGKDSIILRIPFIRHTEFFLLYPKRDLSTTCDCPVWSSPVLITSVTSQVMASLVAPTLEVASCLFYMDTDQSSVSQVTSEIACCKTTWLQSSVALRKHSSMI